MEGLNFLLYALGWVLLVLVGLYAVSVFIGMVIGIWKGFRD